MSHNCLKMDCLSNLQAQTNAGSISSPNWVTIDQMMNKPFESKGEITTDKNKAKNTSFFFFFFCLAWHKRFCWNISSDQHLRDIEEADEISQQRSTGNIITILRIVQRNIKK